MRKKKEKKKVEYPGTNYNYKILQIKKNAWYTCALSTDHEKKMATQSIIKINKYFLE